MSNKPRVRYRPGVGFFKVWPSLQYDAYPACRYSYMTVLIGPFDTLPKAAEYDPTIPQRWTNQDLQRVRRKWRDINPFPGAFG